jgi:peroxiredoxin
LRGIQRQLQDFQKAGVQPVAISVDPPGVSRELAQKVGFTFPLLCDPEAEVVHRYHLGHPGGGPEGREIARPAEFLIDSSGTVRWVNFTEDIRVRARAQEMVAAANTLK